MRNALRLSNWLCLYLLTHIITKAQDPFDVTGRADGIIAFASLGPQHWDLYASSPEEEAQPITRHPALDYNAAYSPDGNRIAFVSERHGNVDLYSMATDGSDQRRLTHSQPMDDHPSWSPDSKEVVFVSTRIAAPAGQAWNQLFVMDANGDHVRPLSDGQAADYSPAWSPRGDLIAFASGHSQAEDLFLIKPDGTERRLLMKNGGWPTFVDGGESVVFHRLNDAGDAWDLWIVSVDGSNAKRLLEKACMPHASADGSAIAFVQQGGDHHQIAVLHRHTGEVSPRTSAPTTHWNPTIAPDGKRVIYHRTTPGQSTPNQRWWAAPPETNVTMMQIDGAFPAFSKDHTRIAFTSQSFSKVDVMKVDGSERHTVFQGTHRSLFGMTWAPAPHERIAFGHGVLFASAAAEVTIKSVLPDGRETSTITTDSSNNGFPSYAPDGSEMVFRSGRDGGKNLYIMDTATRAVRRLTNGAWTDTMGDWSPDGQWIAFSSTRGGDYEIWIVRPDGSGLRKLIGGGGRNTHPIFSPNSDWVVFTSQRAGFSAERVSQPHQPQPYGDLFIIRLDGSGLTRLTHNSFEEGTPAWGRDVR